MQKKIFYSLGSLFIIVVAIAYVWVNYIVPENEIKRISVYWFKIVTQYQSGNDLVNTRKKIKGPLADISLPYDTKNLSRTDRASEFISLAHQITDIQKQLNETSVSLKSEKARAAASKMLESCQNIQKLFEAEAEAEIWVLTAEKLSKQKYILSTDRKFLEETNPTDRIKKLRDNIESTLLPQMNGYFR